MSMKRFADLGLTEDQVSELVKLAAAVCAAAAVENSDPLNWALDFFDDPEALIQVGKGVWDKIDAKYGSL